MADLPTATRRAVAGALLLGAAAAAAYAFGEVEIGFVLAAAAVLAVSICWPMGPTVLTFLLAGTLGSFAGHWIVPGVTLPVFELLLAAGAIAAAIATLRGWRGRSRPGTLTAAIWVPAAIYALFLLVFLNKRDLIPGAREAILLGYPLLIALPFAVVSPARVRSFFDAHGWQLVALASAGAVITGIYNYAIDNTVETSTGQLRALSGEYTAPLAAAVLTAAWLAVYRKRFIVAAALAVLGVVGLLLINQRSAYLALVIALAVFAATGPLPAMIRARPKTALRTAVVLGVLLVLLLSLTPLGRDGVARFGALFDSSDDNYSFRERAVRKALKKDDAGEVILGTGVGLQRTDLDIEFNSNMAEALSSPLRLEPHNSYVTIYQRAGVIGLILMLAPLAFLVWKMIRARRDELVALLLSFFVFMATMATFNVVLENSFFGIWFWFPLFVGAVLALAGGTAAPPSRAGVDARPR